MPPAPVLVSRWPHARLTILGFRLQHQPNNAHLPGVTVDEAIALIRPAVTSTGGIWADLGAGTGLFTRALAGILDPKARIVAVDRNPRSLKTLLQSGEIDPAQVVAAVGDIRRLDTIEALGAIRVAGALFANVLHFVADPAIVLRQTVARLGQDGRIIVVEYEGRSPSRWVPYPLSIDRLAAIAADASLTSPHVVSRRPSAFGGDIYCAVLTAALRPSRTSSP